jgi:hypothetical protein
MGKFSPNFLDKRFQKAEENSGRRGDIKRRGDQRGHREGTWSYPHGFADDPPGLMHNILFEIFKRLVQSFSFIGFTSHC